VIEQLNFGVRQVQRQKSGLWVGVVDVDNFKEINDRYGHFTGDRVLVEIAKHANSRFRKSDLFGRIGGDEFLFAFLHAMPESVDVLSQRAREGFSGFGPPELPEKVTVSIGMASFRQDENESIDDCVERADQALFEAKRNGRDQVVLVS
jgi:diguanylate cyclase (GGDEF)-like protein